MNTTLRENSPDFVMLQAEFPCLQQWALVQEKVRMSSIDERMKKHYLLILSRFDYIRFEEIRKMSSKHITNIDTRYMICFSVGISTSDIAKIFKVAKASVYTMRYRLRKKFPNEKVSEVELL